MPNEFTPNIERDGKWFIGTCSEVPGANGQGRTLLACSRNLTQAIAMVLDEGEEPIRSSATVEVAVANRLQHFEVELLESWEGLLIGCPSLSGCYSQSDDEEEALENIRDAIKDYVEVSEQRQLRNAQLPVVA